MCASCCHDDVSKLPNYATHLCDVKNTLNWRHGLVSSMYDVTEVCSVVWELGNVIQHGGLENN